jgi:hypothetical protein
MVQITCSKAEHKVNLFVNKYVGDRYRYAQCSLYMSTEDKNERKIRGQHTCEDQRHLVHVLAQRVQQEVLCHPAQ